MQQRTTQSQIHLIALAVSDLAVGVAYVCYAILVWTCDLTVGTDLSQLDYCKYGCLVASTRLQNPRIRDVGLSIRRLGGCQVTLLH